MLLAAAVATQTKLNCSAFNYYDIFPFHFASASSRSLSSSRPCTFQLLKHAPKKQQMRGEKSAQKENMKRTKFWHALISDIFKKFRFLLIQLNPIWFKVKSTFSRRLSIRTKRRANKIAFKMYVNVYTSNVRGEGVERMRTKKYLNEFVFIVDFFLFRSLSLSQ